LEGKHVVDNPLIRKLSNVADLTDRERGVLQSLCDGPRTMPADKDLLRQGDRPDHLHLVLEGWAMRYHILPNGSRQISAFLLPGDFCDMHVMALQQMDHSIATLTPAKIAYIPIDQIRELSHQLPELIQALWWATLVDEGVLRAWIVNLGRRTAFKRAGHLICELYERMKNVGLVADEEFNLPLTQTEIADSLGLTPVHLNRVLQRLRKEDLIVLDRQHMTVPDIARLKAASGFDPSYLHPEHVRLG
jgi:CRP-like cAMP-binding protein